MKVGFLFEDNGIINKNLLESPNGNPGIGGTTYMYIILAHYMNRLYKNVEMVFLREGNCPLEDFIISENIGSIENFDRYQGVKQLDLLVINAKNINDKFIEKINNVGVKTIIWGHNYLSAHQANIIADCENIKRMVFVGHQEYDKYIDHRIIKKSTYIYNMLNAELPCFYRNEDYKPYVTYVGSLTRPKGFHILAKYWKQIVKEVPKAQLHVIGGGNLYAGGVGLGSYGIADEAYEKEFMPYLTDENGEILPSVVFHGVMGQEKTEIFHDTAVGVINPSAETETFGIGAVEMSACGIPVVTRRMYGLIDTVKDKETGLLFDKYDDFPKLIVRLLNDRGLNKKYGENGKEFIKLFSPTVITEKWHTLFADVIEDKAAEIQFPSDNFGVDNKWLRTANFCVKKVLPFLPSVIETTDFVKSVLKRR